MLEIFSFNVFKVASQILDLLSFPKEDVHYRNFVCFTHNCRVRLH